MFLPYLSELFVKTHHFIPQYPVSGYQDTIHKSFSLRHYTAKEPVTGKTGIGPAIFTSQTRTQYTAQSLPLQRRSHRAAGS